MANYENGANTRQMIIAACKQLFYHKGFHETSFGDICKEAHINRGTLYYHFKTKEEMRYEVQCEFIVANKHIAEKYCTDPRYLYILATGLYWEQAHRDEKLRRFCLQYCIDFPVYTGKKDPTLFYYTIYDGMWGQFWDQQKISQLAFASVYGYIMSCMRMLCEHPEKYDATEMFEHCIRSSTAIWGIPQEILDQICQNVRQLLSLIPEEEIRVQLP